MSRQSAYTGHGQNALYMESCQVRGIDAYGFPARAIAPPPPPPCGLTYSSHLWERTSISLPDVLPVTASEKLRHRCVMKSIKSIKEMTGKWESKLRLLNSRFDSTVATHLGLADVQRTMNERPIVPSMDV
jgi:hypothetical protein